METLYTYDFGKHLQQENVDVSAFIQGFEQLVIKKKLYANLLKNNDEDDVDLFVIHDGQSTLKICAMSGKYDDKQFDFDLQTEPDIVKSQLKKAELKLQDDYNSYVRLLESGQKPYFTSAFRNLMTCIKTLDNPNELVLGDETIALRNYDHTIVAKTFASEPLLEADGIAESFQLNDLTFIINPDPINGLCFEKIRVKASEETSFNVIRARCNGCGVSGRYKLEKVGSSYLLKDFVFKKPSLYLQP